MRGVKQSFTTQNQNRAPDAIDMTLVDGPFRRFAAAWRFRPLGEQACKVEFSMEFEFSSRALATLLQPVFKHIQTGAIVEPFLQRGQKIGRPDERGRGGCG
jgi:ribosome-associated toxin RatA of RatAB toxin-antitoxin module